VKKSEGSVGRVALLAFMWFALVSCGTSTLTAASGSSSNPTPRAAGAHAQSATLSFAGQARDYILFKPNQPASAGPTPLVIAMHGWTQSAAQMLVTSRFDDLAEQQGFMVAYPSGYNESWNAGQCCDGAVTSKVDDVAFIKQLIDFLITNDNADPKRVFIAGLSNGGAMAYRLACELSNRITAVASVSGALFINRCSPARPVSVMEIHGTTDSLVPFEGGNDPLLGGNFPGQMSVLTQWAHRDGCATLPDIVKTGSTDTYTWKPCRARSVVALIAVIGADHGWFAGPTQPDAATLIWEFFSQVPPMA
jgi:polyhydroxybutyrate depolymerase